MNNISSDTLRKLLKNPHYKLNKAEDVKVYTQELREDDTPVVAPIVRKRRTRKSKKNAKSSRD